MTTYVKEKPSEIASIFKDKAGSIADKVILAANWIEENKDSFVYDFGKGDVELSQLSCSKGRLVSHMYVKEVLPYGFSLIAVTYSAQFLSKPVWDEKGLNIIEPTKYAYELDRIYEMSFDLRYHKKSIRKNGKELSFAENNLRGMFGGYKAKDAIRVLDELSESNLYSMAYPKLSVLGGEYTSQLARFFARLLELHKIELIYKSGVPEEFTESLLRDLSMRFSKSRYPFHKQKFEGNLEGSTPAEVLGVPKSVIKLISAGYIGYNRYIELHKNINDLIAGSMLPRCEGVDEDGEAMTEEEIQAENNRRGALNVRNQRISREKIVRACGEMYSIAQYCEEWDKEYGMDVTADVIGAEMYTLMYFAVDARKAKVRNRSNATTIARKTKANLKTVIHYLYYRLYIEQGYSYGEVKPGEIDSQVGKTYFDYIDMCSTLGLSKERYPRYLLTEHDIVQRNLALLDNPEMQEQFEGVVDSFTHYDDVKMRKQWSDKYVVITPKTVRDLAKEGTSLHHCVLNYVTRVIAGTTVVLFLRKANAVDDSLVTLAITWDLDGSAVMSQAEGINRRSITWEEDAFLADWCKAAGVKYASLVDSPR